ncbi:hypothetical protein N7508_004808 [Penicillium antarcticum]|uniref:uncharacterized protein n=1 Tax=Penicillium antarcticum TaxID=416450 RepID=UPI00239D00FA|nr:uncharacterized protein N7508_004808 [Penicillium antarcticum]KAJ5305793.1 hypothetical protein N7508_004808 [Penicillium antarcticum]
MDLANLLSHTVYTPKDSSHYKRSAPLSPPVEEPKCSLPSISALLEGADGQHSAKRQRLSPHREDIRHYEMPPTPPLRPGSGNGQSRASPVTTKESNHRSSISSTSSIHINAQPYASPAPSVSSYTSPVEAPQHHQHMYYTRPPTASTFNPATPVTVPAPMPTLQTQHHHAHGHSHSHSASSALISPVTPAWQHHHYFPPSTAAPYQQNHDRYICRTCHKAFSRPSSLRIHSHSHTGEKPFRCTHAGCGKAFSVRSNMKRHERGCHSGRPVSANATALVV